ncbi:MAG: macro domain-containing protein [Gemmatimonadetes bacterium]|nr:macro domain-containing protein [Gemmatimonadota bacterium]
MIRFKTGDILADQADALVNTVNCVGVMGRGIALQFKRAFPENFRAYAAACRRGEMQPGRMFVYETGELVAPRYIINFPSKRHWRGKSRIEDIESGLASLTTEIRSRRIRSIAIPPLGSGLGGLDWPLVRNRIESALDGLDEVDVVVYEPGGGPVDSRANRSRDVPNMTPGRAALVGLLDRYLRGLLDPFVTLLEAHKLMYFMQVAGEPLKLRITKGHYGPYAENLRHVLLAIEGHMVSGYSDGGDRPDKRLRLVPGATTDASAFLSTEPATNERFSRVADLVEGFESRVGLELLSTVHWVIQEENAQTLDDIIDRVSAWSPGSKSFSRRQIAIAHGVLAKKGWIKDYPEHSA